MDPLESSKNLPKEREDETPSSSFNVPTEVTCEKLPTGLDVVKFRNESIAAFPIMQKPTPIGYFSINSDHDYEQRADQLRYFKLPVLPLNLNIGLHNVVKNPVIFEDKKRLDHLLRYIFYNKAKLFKSLEEVKKGWPFIGSEFVCFRDLLTTLMSTPYESKNNWTIYVTRYMGTFYFNKCDILVEQRNREQMQNAEQQKIAAWDYIFKQHCLSERPLLNPDNKMPADECSEFVCVFKTKLEGTELLYASEIDGVRNKNLHLRDTNLELSEMVFILLKLFDISKSPLLMQNVGREWWCEAFLAGIENIFLGSRSADGFVHEFQYLSSRSFSKTESADWQPSKCVLFIVHFFACLRQVMAGVNCPYTTFEFSFDAKSSSLMYNCNDGISEHSFLPEWYMGLLKRNAGTPIEEHYKAETK